MDISLTFVGWFRKGEPLYQTVNSVELSMGVFHFGSTFDGVIYLPEDDTLELARALEQGFIPRFQLWPGEDNPSRWSTAKSGDLAVEELRVIQRFVERWNETERNAAMQIILGAP